MKLRSKLGPIVLALVLLLVSGQLAVAQVDWSFEDLVVPPGDPGSWDSYRHQVAGVVFDGTTYHMFLVAGQTWHSFDAPWSVGHWTSTSLTGPWEEDVINNPVLSPEPGEWDGFTIYSAAVRYHEGLFKMWYGAAAAYPGECHSGYAESVDGSVWIKYPGNPLPGLEPGPPGEWDDGGCVSNAVLFDGAEYRMWFTCAKEGGPPYGTWRFGTATSPYGITWTKHPDPVLEGSLPWEASWLYFPEVISYGGGYAMWYSAAGSGAGGFIGYATSPDGIHWGRWPDNPVLTPSCPENVIGAMAVIVEGSTVHGWATHCRDVWHLTSPLEVVFFDTFETGDTTVWSSVVP